MCPVGSRPISEKVQSFHPTHHFCEIIWKGCTRGVKCLFIYIFIFISGRECLLLNAFFRIQEPKHAQGRPLQPLQPLRSFNAGWSNSDAGRVFQLPSFSRLYPDPLVLGFSGTFFMLMPSSGTVSSVLKWTEGSSSTLFFPSFLRIFCLIDYLLHLRYTPLLPGC